MSTDLQITSGVGPLEVRRFVGLLGEHLEALAAARGLLVEHVAWRGELGAPRSVTVTLTGPAAAVLADQLGTHELVHRFDTRGKAARKRWFAAVSLHDTPPTAAATSPPRDELQITACRAGGPGGQHVNKVATAVRVVHLPTGLSVRSAAARSQKANLEVALARLAALLAAEAAAAASTKLARARLAHYQVVRGQAVATYTLDDGGTLVPR